MAGDRRVLIGFDQVGDPVVRTSTPGHDVIDDIGFVTHADGSQAPDEISFDSRWASWGKIHKKGSKTGFGFVNFDTLPHYPMVQVWIEDSSGFLHHQNIRTIQVAREWWQTYVRMAGPSFFVDVEKHRFNIISMLNLYPDVGSTESVYLDGIDCGTSPTFHYIVWDIEGFA